VSERIPNTGIEGTAEDKAELFWNCLKPLTDEELIERCKVNGELSESDLAAFDKLKLTHPRLWYYIREIGQVCQVLLQENKSFRGAKWRCEVEGK
jgi:hypothetical protein